jgi:hypothetical protein
MPESVYTNETSCDVTTMGNVTVPQIMNSEHYLSYHRSPLIKIAAKFSQQYKTYNN